MGRVLLTLLARLYTRPAPAQRTAYGFDAQYGPTHILSLVTLHQEGSTVSPYHFT